MPDVAVQDKGTRVDALVQEALQSDSIKRYLDDDDFARQVRIAADTIIEQYVFNGQDGGISKLDVSQQDEALAPSSRLSNASGERCCLALISPISLAGVVLWALP